ncbi:microviridin/marinostatin family tricyclic proteinase inhibitor [uncultured Chryseobacterium sp.]|uniref:microviridin/marinostatin family tricyclic proteinase inhibitor n=1 Tax=uncultured Chryseobacterium sp. TaxID=259322 RepID=UPI0025EC38DD|nr:microviridin/marinostatin family tricyclic proteinase inhibitor [uncultured Chryseobacterium sp.]
MKGKKLKKPFFAAFLEKQVKDPETIKGGSGTGVLKDQVTGVQNDDVTSPGNDTVSMKYPSDSDESGEIDL